MIVSRATSKHDLNPGSSCSVDPALTVCRGSLPRVSHSFRVPSYEDDTWVYGRQWHPLKASFESDSSHVGGAS